MKMTKKLKRLDIGKKTFVKCIEQLKKGDEREEQFQESLTKISDSWFINTLGSEWKQVAICLLCKAVKDIPDRYGTTLEWWLYEDVEKIIYFEDEPLDVSTPEKLYDFYKYYNW